MLTLLDRATGEIEVLKDNGPAVLVRGDDAALDLLLAKVEDGNGVDFIRGYSPYGSFGTWGSEVRQNEAKYRAGLWGFEGGHSSPLS
jgi:hypothetical protein